MKRIFGKLKKGIKVMKDKTMDKVEAVSTYLKNDRNRVILGTIIMGIGLGGGLIISGYVQTTV